MTKPELSPYRKQIFQKWKKRQDGVPDRQRFEDRFEELRKTTGLEMGACFFNAYYEMAAEIQDPIEFDPPIPEEYQQVIEPPPPVDLSVLDGKPPVDVLDAIRWAHDAPSISTPLDAPSPGAWFFFDMRTNNKGKFADILVRVADRLSEKVDEQKSRNADFDKAIRLLEKSAKPDLSEEDYREVRQVLRGRAKGSQA